MTASARETLVLISELTATPVMLRQLHLAHAVFRLNAAEQFRARKGFRTIVYGGLDHAIFKYMLPHGVQDGMFARHCGGGRVHEYYYIHDRKHGTHAEWNVNNQLVALGTYVADKMYGTYVEWSGSGRVEYVGMYVAGRRHGACTTYYRSGCRKYLNFVNDRMHGDQKSVRPDGTIIEHVVVDQGEYLHRIL